ncbi:GyrI-like domain-containing protein, partial [Shewanella algae]|uniref:AraC family transcriptional regulator n=1 Tax=Shewanella algae TaxID=38313 RepID=UPI00313B19A2
DLVAEDKLRSVACVNADASAPVAAPLERRAISGGEYAVLHHKGPYAEMHKAYKWLYAEWLPKSGRKLRDALMFEEYLNNPRDVAPSEL